MYASVMQQIGGGIGLTVVIAILGGIALLVGLFGGGITAQQIVIPRLPNRVRIVSSLTGILLIGMAILIDRPIIIDPPATLTPSTTRSPTSAPAPTNTPTATSSPTATLTPTPSSTPTPRSSPTPTATLTPSPSPTPFTYLREGETADSYSVGQVIPRINASGLKVHGQFGTIESPGYPAKSGCVIYAGISLPKVEHLYLNIYYSKHSPSTVPVYIYVNDELRTFFQPQDQGDWNRFTWAWAIDLGKIESGLHSIKFCTDGQQYGVADFDRFTLTTK